MLNKNNPGSRMMPATASLVVAMVDGKRKTYEKSEYGRQLSSNYIVLLKNGKREYHSYGSDGLAYRL